MKQMKFVKKALLFCATFALLASLTTVMALDASALSLSDFGVANNRPNNSTTNRNAITNGGFESTSNAQWNTDTFLQDGLLFVTDDPTAPEGDKVLCYQNTSSTPSWRKFTVTGLTKNQKYYFSVWVKTPYLSATNKAKASIGVMDPDTDGDAFAMMTDMYKGHVSWTTEQIRSTATDNEWHLRSVEFTVPSSGQVTIGIYGYSSVMYFDDIALHRANGTLISYSTKYQGERLTTSLSASNTGNNKYCTAENNLIPDANLNGSASTEFWTKNSSGWNNGYMSFADSGDSQGRVMKYSASSNPFGLNYFKWLKVEPNTSYTLTFKYKITRAGSGSIKLVDNNIELPKSFKTVSLSSAGNWTTFSVTFDSKVFTQVGFVIQDKGGEVLMDDFRLFKSDNGTSTEPAEVVYPTLKPANTGTSTSDPENPVDGVGNAVAFRVELPTAGMTIGEAHSFNYANATVDALGTGEGYQLVTMGAIMCNNPNGASADHMVIGNATGGGTINIVAEKGISVADGIAEYAVRIKNIPNTHIETTIYARPYYVFKYDGEDIYVYGDIVSRCYKSAPNVNDGQLDWS